MAEVTLWIEEDGVRTSISVEADSKDKALKTALSYIKASGGVVGVDISPADAVRHAGEAYAKHVLTAKEVEAFSPVHITSLKHSKVNGMRDSDKVIKLAERLGYELTGGQKECIRAWFDK